jgi:hypothetical protein
MRSFAGIRASRVTRGLAVVLVVAAGTFVGSWAQPAGAVTVFQAHTYNMAMSNPDINASRPDHRAETMGDVQSIALQQHPWTISLQEVCYDQLTHMNSNLHPYAGMWGVMVITRPITLQNPAPFWDRCQHAGQYQGRGNAAMAIGVENSMYVSGDLQPSDGAPRKAVCTRKQNIGFLYDTCSVHLSQYPSYAIYQVGNLFNWSTGSQAIYNVTGGDFNQEYIPPPPPWPPQPAATGLMQYYFRGDEMNLPTITDRTMVAQNKKLDYVFAHRSRSARAAPQTCVSTNGHSDHKYCIAQFTFQ